MAEEDTCCGGCCLCLRVTELQRRSPAQQTKVLILPAAQTTPDKSPPWIGRIDVEKLSGKQPMASPRAIEIRKSVLSCCVFNHIPSAAIHQRELKNDEHPAITRLVCKRFWQTLPRSDTAQRSMYRRRREQDTAFNEQVNENRGERGKHIIQGVILVNVLHGIAQTVLAIAFWDKSCEYPFYKFLITCGVPNIVMATTYSLICMSQDDLFPRDEDDDEEMGWPLYVAGFVLWICWILDFSSWMIMSMLLVKTDHCHSDLENATMANVIIRAFLLFMQISLVVWHLKNKVRDENKRKFGVNPMKFLFSKKHFGEDSEDEEEMVPLANV